MEAKFVDVHNHLDMCKDISEVATRAKENNVLIIAAGVDHKSNAALINLSKDYGNLKVCLGLYPTEVEKLDDKGIEKEINFITEHKDNIVGIAEIGLDLYEAEELDIQKKGLRKFINLAKDLNLPVVVHSRKAEEKTIEFLEGFKYSKVIMHCFSGSMKLVQRIIDNGWNLSIPATVKYSEHFQKIVEMTPIEQLFCETDSPFLHPEKERNNEPANVIEGYKKIAEIKNLDLEEVKEKIWKNFRRDFNIS